jgi:hypothetical protein
MAWLCSCKKRRSGEKAEQRWRRLVLTVVNISRAQVGFHWRGIWLQRYGPAKRPNSRLLDKIGDIRKR